MAPKVRAGFLLGCACLFFWVYAAESRESSPRALFVSVIQNPQVLSSRTAIDDLIKFSEKTHIRVLFVQVYRANKAWFASSVADSGPYRDCLRSVGADPLRLVIRKAHASGIQVHAWFNLLSLSANADAPILKKYGPEILTRNLREKRTLEDYKIDQQYFLEPGDPRVQKALATVVAEVVQAYPDLDGVQLDYIRYPDAHPGYGYTLQNMHRFKRTTGALITEDSPAWKQWKYGRVTGLVKRLVRKARAIHPGIQVSTTGLMPYSRATLESFQDWRLWLDSGLVDFVTLMCYVDDVPTFKKYLRNAEDKMGNLKKVNIAVGAYKLLRSPKIFQDQWKACEESVPRSCAVLHYGSLIENPALENPLIGKDTI